MNTMKRLFIFLCFIFVLGLFACEKNEDLNKITKGLKEKNCIILARGYLSTFNQESLHTSTRGHSQPRGVIVFTQNIVRYYHVGHTIVTQKSRYLNSPGGS